jgi:hypothetical protein
MDRDAREPERRDQAPQEDTGMIGSETEEPGPGRDTSLTDPDSVAAGVDQPRSTVAMSEGDPMRTRLGSQVEGAGAIGYDVAAAEERATQQTPAEERPGYESERPGGEAPAAATAPGTYEREPRLAEPAGYEREPELAEPAAYEREPGWTGSGVDDAPFERRPDEATSDRVDEGVYDQEADPARRQRPSDGT